MSKFKYVSCRLMSCFDNKSFENDVIGDTFRVFSDVSTNVLCLYRSSLPHMMSKPNSPQRNTSEGSTTGLVKGLVQQFLRLSAEEIKIEPPLSPRSGRTAMKRSTSGSF